MPEARTIENFPSKTKRRQTFMKTIRKIMLLAVCALATAALAQQNPPPQGGGDDQGGRRRGMPSVEDQVKGLTERLGLNDEQQAKVKTILEDTRSQMGKVMQDESMSREDKMAKGRSLRETSNTKIREVLTDEQKKKFDDMQKEMQERQRQRQQGGGDSNPK
jgi:Spy/CpxP family protein refolding chaperone